MLLVALAAIQAAPPVDYRALGTEPFWSVEAAGDRLTWRGLDPDAPVPPAPATVTRDGTAWTWATPRLVMRTRPGPCSDGMSDRFHAEHVSITFDGRQYTGCGNPVIAAAPLEGTRWTIALVDGRAPRLSRPATIAFSADRVTGRVCNSFNGGYSLARGTIRVGALATTRMACPDAEGAAERAVLAALARPLKVHRGGPGSLVLSDGRRSVSLRRAR